MNIRHFEFVYVRQARHGDGNGPYSTGKQAVDGESFEDAKRKFFEQNSPSTNYHMVFIAANELRTSSTGLLFPVLL